ncbi:hypothetical protein FI667_g7990, partial [Globisporangium splendens]
MDSKFSATYTSEDSGLRQHTFQECGKERERDLFHTTCKTKGRANEVDRKPDASKCVCRHKTAAVAQLVCRGFRKESRDDCPPFSAAARRYLLSGCTKLPTTSALLCNVTMSWSKKVSARCKAFDKQQSDVETSAWSALERHDESQLRASTLAVGETAEQRNAKAALQQQNTEREL